MNGRIIFLLPPPPMHDWVHISLSGHEDMYLACSCPCLPGLVVVSFLRCELWGSVSPHQIFLHARCRSAEHVTHVQLSTVGVSLTPWRLGLPALRDRLFPLRVLWLRGDHVPIHHCLFFMSLWVQHTFPEQPHQNSLLCWTHSCRRHGAT